MPVRPPGARQKAVSLSCSCAKFFETLHFQARIELMFVVAIFQRSYHLHQEGAISEPAWDEATMAFLYVASQPGFEDFWQAWQHAYAPDIRAVMQSLWQESQAGADARRFPS